MANVVMPEKMESAVTAWSGGQRDDAARSNEFALTFIVPRIDGLVWEAHIVEGHLRVVVMVIVRNDASGEGDECEEAGEGLHDVLKVSGRW